MKRSCKRNDNRQEQFTCTTSNHSKYSGILTEDLLVKTDSHSLKSRQGKDRANREIPRIGCIAKAEAPSSEYNGQSHALTSCLPALAQVTRAQGFVDVRMELQGFLAEC
eukprot:1148747-Pelagomonas_calceolata.AAC.1